jgi:uncharacterized protein (DUF2147 family)
MVRVEGVRVGLRRFVARERRSGLVADVLRDAELMEAAGFAHSTVDTSGLGVAAVARDAAEEAEALERAAIGVRIDTGGRAVAEIADEIRVNFV